MNGQEVSRRITDLLPDASVKVSGEDCNFSVLVVSDEFAELRPVARQQQILRLFGEELASGRLHALTVDACTTAELSARQSTLTSISL
ncbi:MAG: cell division protein BolA [Oceanospirillaceae bacterium]|nr:cell division protein BolA [Oceanospirillaceae bacterium]